MGFPLAKPIEPITINPLFLAVAAAKSKGGGAPCIPLAVPYVRKGMARYSPTLTPFLTHIINSHGQVRRISLHLT